MLYLCQYGNICTCAKSQCSGTYCWLIKSQLIDYVWGHIVFWDKPLQFYAN